MTTKLPKFREHFDHFFHGIEEKFLVPVDTESQLVYDQVLTHIGEWFEEISKKTGIETVFLEKHWKLYNQKNKEKNKNDESKENEIKKKIKNNDKSVEENKDNKEKKRICPYVFVSGTRKNEVCGSGIRDPEQMYCSKHRNRENKNSKKVNKEENSINKKVVVKEMVKHVTRLNQKIKKYVHESTGMVFISKEEKIVFGHWDGNTVLPLTDDDKQVCSIYQFHIDPMRYEEQMKIINSE